MTKENNKLAFYGLVAMLFLLGITFNFYRNMVSDIPWSPKNNRSIWSIEAKIDFKAVGDAVKVVFSIPDTQPGFERVSERTASPGYGLLYTEKDNKRLTQWSIRSADGPQTLYYQVDFLTESFPEKTRSTPPPIKKTRFTGPQATAADTILQQAKHQSMDNFSLALAITQQFIRSSEQARLLTQKKTKEHWVVALLQNAGVPARRVKSLILEDGRRRQSLRTMIQVFEGEHYHIIDPETGEIGQQRNHFLWEQSTGSIVDLLGGKGARVSFSMIKKEIPLSRLIQNQIESNTGFLNFSIHALPLEEQAVFKGILLIPVGVLVVVFLRILIGIRTSGTFMPVLIAISFIQTSLLTGLIGFVLVVSVGLLIRSYLSRHNLLLVSRISAVIISVIFIIAVFSVVSFRVGLSEGLKISFFPVIILSWTIERMSILWEEEGAEEVFKQVGGSLFVAVLAYAVMSNIWVRHLTFNFIGFQFIFLASVLWLGNYTGYRLTELYRFSNFGLEKKEA